MNSRVSARAAGLALAAVIALAAYGCGKKAGVHMLIPNERPTVLLTSAPVDMRDTAFYSYRLDWSGDDPDGQVDHYLFAVDPKPADTLWTTSTKNEQTLIFRSMNPAPGAPNTVIRSIEPHTFVIKAVDNHGLASALAVRSFFSYTVAPSVSISSPLPSDLLLRMLTPSCRITWEGHDPDGQFTQKPVKYKYKLFVNGGTEFPYSIMRTNPDSLRRFYARTNFAGWDSVGGDTTSVQFTGLTPQKQYVFVVIGYDEAGAYSPLFTLTGNMLQFEVGFAGTLGPIISAWNESFYYSMASGGFAPNNPVTWVHLEVPAGRRTTINWSAAPPPGSLIQWYRWRLDGDVFDETPRTNETDDWYHWSAKSSGTTSCTIGPFTPNVQTFFYLEAMDNNGLLSLLTIVLHPVVPTFENDLLIVNDTRLEVDNRTSSGGIQMYSSTWPAKAELDTFLFARGGVPWRGTQVPVSVVPQPVSAPGLFAGYSFDTLGTRLGLAVASAGVPLSLLGKYKHVIWLIDHNGSFNELPANDLLKPMSVLAYMSAPNHMNTLGSYMIAGGSVWLLGGAAAYATLRSYNNRTNDVPSAFRYNYTNVKNELIPGRLMFDAAHWQIGTATQTVPAVSHTVFKSSSVPQSAWTSPGLNFSHPITSPNYDRLPAAMRPKLLEQGDTLPPTRYYHNPSVFYSPSTFDVEYLTLANRILEDTDPDPFTVREVSVLDTLMDVRGVALPDTTRFVAMTYYHGVVKPEFVFSGFNIWNWSRADDIQLVDFVLKEIWKLPHNDALRWTPQSRVRAGGGLPSNVRPGGVPAGALSRLPRARTAGR